MEDPSGGPKSNNIDYDGDYRPTFHDFYDLMKFKVSKILLVSSLYDAFTLEEDGLLSEQLSGNYQDLALSSPPRVIRVSSGEDALKELEQEGYDLIITMARLVDMDPFDFGKRAKELQPDVPVVMLLTDAGDLPLFYRPGKRKDIDKIFFWNGDSALFLAITKYVEDRINVGPDTGVGVVRVILVIEDSPRYYSMFLPLIYAEIMRQTASLIAEGLNDHEKLFRRRARPKILLAETFEEGMELYLRYKRHILGIITDVTYPRGDKSEKEAGFQFINVVEKDIPVLLQSSRQEHKEKADALNIPFLNKHSETLLQDLRKFFKERLGFGGFVFSMPDGIEVGLAFDMKEFAETVQRVPAGSLRHHALANDFSNWLMARGVR
jgi:CheY-like chemotaxis protein